MLGFCLKLFTIDDEIEIIKLFNKYFVDIVKNSTENSLSEVQISIAKYRNHSSIITIAEKMEKLGNPTTGFDFTSYEERVKEVINLKIRKVSQKTDIPVKIIKENIDTVSYFLYQNFNNSLSCSTFPTGMKYVKVTSFHKTDDKTDKENYLSLSILPKVYERLKFTRA